MPSGQISVAAQGRTAAPLTSVNRKENQVPFVLLARFASSMSSTMKQAPATGVAVGGTGTGVEGPTPQGEAPKAEIQLKTMLPCQEVLVKFQSEIKGGWVKGWKPQAVPDPPLPLMIAMAELSKAPPSLPKFDGPNSPKKTGWARVAGQFAIFLPG